MKSEAKKSSVTFGFPITEISIKQTKVRLILNEVQTSPNGRPFRLSGSRQNLQQPQKYIQEEKTYMHHYYHSFIYLDQQGGMFEIECDYKNKYINNSFKKL